MRWLVMIGRGTVLLLVMALTGLIIYLTLVQPELLRVGTGYAAKIVCSNVFIAGRPAADVLSQDVQAPGNPLLRLIDVEVNEEERWVTARFMSAFTPSTAIYREGLGCANVPDGDVEAARAVSLPQQPPIAGQAGGFWPQGDMLERVTPRLGAVLSNRALTGPGMRAVVVVRDGRIIGEVYGPGFGPTTPLLGWSITKTVNAALIGRLIAEERLDLTDSELFDEWKGDDRGKITLSQLLAMESGLAFNENYGDVADVTRMLYLEPDMARFAASGTLEASPGTKFSYSSGTAVLLSKIWMNRFASSAEALAYPREALFRPLGMTSAVMEADAAGTFVGSSYLYASARDWARFGLFLLQDGMWNGERLLPEGYVAALREPTPLSGGNYTKVQAWANGPGGGSDASFGLPEDTTWLQGHDGQTIAIVPSERLVVVRLGLTPSRRGYRPQTLLNGVLESVR
ncbi:serine hydrolase [Rhizobium sp. RU36D]|uniref:serine hydrolase domain-containing protein n=1 Tax=Rhizobium sp. RU36D TaxID=1907415 RepID=UPI0009D821C2|nr:serine hydrolase [Rhizobium sp. RU36D]SMC59531.1 hypothetical protein SAMN05880593_103135 [Rhizobium sp. RU36D]